MRAAARSYSLAGIQRLAELAGLTEHPPAENEAVQAACIAQLLDRGFGKVAQLIAGDDERPVSIRFEWAPASQSESDSPAIEGQPACEAEMERRPALELVWEQDSES
jgi:hypothetical protein